MKFVLFRHSARALYHQASAPSCIRSGQLTWLHRFVSVFSVFALLLVNEPVILTAQTAGTQSAPPRPVASNTPIKVNRTVPHVVPPSGELTFSSNPTDAEIFAKTPFEEPLVPIGGNSTPADNKALTQALLAFSHRTVRDDYSALESFLSTYPNSVWRIALLTDLGWCYRQTGWYSKAMISWKQAWDLGSKVEAVGKGKPIIDRALTELIVLNARVGRMDQLSLLIPLANNRLLEGSSKEKIEGAKQALILMQTRPEVSFVCGPLAVEKIRNMQDGNNPAKLNSGTLKSTQKGTSLIQLKADAKKLGMDYIAAQRDSGAAIITPAVIHWKLGHFATLVAKERGFYHLYDPTFSQDVWVSERAIDSEASGYFLIKNQTLPVGWHAVSDDVAGTVWGKGTNDGGDPDCTGVPAIGAGGVPSGDPGTCPSDDGGGGTGGGDGSGDGGNPNGIDTGSGSWDMARYSVMEMLESLSVRDTPLFYAPAYGPRVSFVVRYAQREANQPSTFTYSNLGPLWTFNWLSYLTDDPSNPGSNVSHYMSGGGVIIYTGYNASTQTYAPQTQSGGVLIITNSSSYELDLPSGAKQFFTAATTTTPRKIFLTKVQDPIGNALTFTYDSNFRLVSCTDAMGQVSTVNYGNANDIYKITSVTDPFGRTASFSYTANGYLQSSTDVSGIVSNYGYTNQNLTSLTTPYGTTRFDVGQNSNDRWVQITDPQGAAERYETWNNYNYNTPASVATYPSGVDNSYLNLRNTFHWTKKQMLVGAGNYADCNIIHWCHETNLSVMSDQIESIKHPLESRVYFNYPNQSVPYMVGTSGQPSRETRILDDGSTQEYDATYNALNNVTSATDPKGRVTQYVYAANNIDLLEIHQGATLPGDLLASFTHYPNHLLKTATDASGQTTSCTYNAQGQILTVTDPLGEVTSFAYYSSGASQGYLQSVTGPQPGSTTTYTWDGYGRMQSITDVNGYTTTYNYDNLNRLTQATYPDGTTDQRIFTNLSLTQTKDRQNRSTRYFYNSVEQLVGILDSANRAISYDRCICGELKGITDPLGHRTSWNQDIEGRIISKTFFDNSTITKTYENNTSRPKTVTDTAGQITTWTYNGDNSVNGVVYTNATVATSPVSYTYDTIYPRVTSMTDGTGTTNYTYNSVVSGILGSGRLASETSPLGPTATVSYTYDALGRTTVIGVNGTNSTLGFDSLGRVDTVNNPLGTFTYSYVGTTPRLQSISSTNGPTTNLSYLTVNQGVRLGEIQNLTHGGTALSKFDYTYNPVSTIATWQQQQDSNTPTVWNYNYDGVNQLLSATKTNTSTNAVISNYVYQYDLAGNRTSEQIDMSVESTSYNNLNQIAGTSTSGSMEFSGTLSKPSTVTINGNAASVDANNNFSGFAPVTPGTNSVQIVAKDYSNNYTTNNYLIIQPTNSTNSVTYDTLGNMLNNGLGQTYQWDAKNELVGITYSGSAIQNNITQTSFSYDGRGRRVSIVEKNSSGTVVSTKQHLWVGNAIVEERDASNTVQKRFYDQGVQISGTNYYYTRDHLGSIREMIDSSGNILARYDYDPYGRVTLIQGTNFSDFQYAGYYEHQGSGLNLTKYREYNPNTGRWINRDPKAENGGLNLYAYCFNDSINGKDPFGLDMDWTPSSNSSGPSANPGGNDPIPNPGGGTGPSANPGGGTGPSADPNGGSGPSADPSGGSGPNANPSGGSGPNADPSGGSGPNADPSGGSGPNANPGGGDGSVPCGGGGSPDPGNPDPGSPDPGSQPPIFAPIPPPTAPDITPPIPDLPQSDFPTPAQQAAQNMNAFLECLPKITDFRLQRNPTGSTAASD